MTSYDSIENALNEAKNLVMGERAREYGDPTEAHQVIANFWSTYLGHEITPQDVAIMLTLMKISRLKNAPDHEDSLVDAISYLAIGKAHQDKHLLDGSTVE